MSTSMHSATSWLASIRDADFQPHPLLRNGHLQTCMAAWWKGPQATYAAQRHQVATTLGDQLVLHDDRPIDWRDGDPVALLIHGLGGCHRSAYMVRIAAKLTDRGVRAFRMDMRGCGAGTECARHPGHAGRSEDVAAAVAYIRAACPSSRLFAAGFSLGGNILLKWLGESATTAGPTVDRAVAVSVPIDLVRCAENIQRRERLVYNRWFVRGLLSQLDRLRDQFSGLAELDLTRPPQSLYEFDDRVTAPLSGFAGAAEYYAACSSIRVLHQITTPTLLLCAADDPLIPADMYAQVRDTPALTVRMLQHGGHVGFFARRQRDPDWHWLDWRIVELAESGYPERYPVPSTQYPVGTSIRTPSSGY